MATIHVCIKSSVGTAEDYYFLSNLALQLTFLFVLIMKNHYSILVPFSILYCSDCLIAEQLHNEESLYPPPSSFLLHVLRSRTNDIEKVIFFWSCSIIILSPSLPRSIIIRPMWSRKYLHRYTLKRCIVIQNSTFIGL